MSIHNVTDCLFKQIEQEFSIISRAEAHYMNWADNVSFSIYLYHAPSVSDSFFCEVL